MELRRKRTIRYAAGGALSVLMLGQCAPDGCAPVPPPPPPPPVELQVLSFNDFHGHLQPPTGSDATLGTTLDPAGTPVGGAEHLASTLKALRTGVPNSVTVAAGDLIGGSPFLSGLFHDEPAVESLDAMGLDVSSVGNHEFDEGATELLRMQYGGCHPEDGCYAPWGEGGYPGANFSWLAANVVRTSTGRTVLPGTTVREVEGVKVGYIGMTLEGTSSIVSQAGIRGIEFRDEVVTANAAAAQLRQRGVETIIVLLHEGGLQAGTYQGCTGISGPIVDIARGLDPEIDLVVTGHTHQPYVCTIPDPSGQPRMVTSASSYGRVVTETRLFMDRATGEVDRARTTSTNRLVARTTPDPTQTAIIGKWSTLAGPVGGQVVGTISADLVRSAGRNTEGPLANVIADAQVAATQAQGAQLALMNPGGVRADLTYAAAPGGGAAGEVTFAEAFAVQPFSNFLVTMDLTGEQLQRVLEQQALATRALLVLGISDGLRFTYDPAAPIGSRVPDASVTLNGTAIDPTTTYRVTTNSFLADGGDGFTVFREGTNRVSTGDDLDALTAYLDVRGPVGPPGDRIAGV